MNQKLTLKEALVIITISILATPLGYLLLTAPPGWWLK